MKGVLEFNLPEEGEEFQTAQDGGKWRNVVWDLAEELRKWSKYGRDGRELIEQEKRVVLDIRNLIYAMLEEKKLSLE